MANKPTGPQDDDRDGGTITVTRTEKKLQKPKLYKVLLHNDDYTTMEFVVLILQSVFHHSDVEATRIMLHVHRNGVGVAGIFTFEIAESKVGKTASLAKEHGYPLLCTMEPEE